MNNIPDWAEFIFVAGSSKYFGAPMGYMRVGKPSLGKSMEWSEATYRTWKRDSRSEIIVRQLEND